MAARVDAGGRRLRKALLASPRLYRAAGSTVVLGRYAVHRPHDPDFAVFRRYPAGGLFLDVGANTGTSALSFRCFDRHTPVLSIEANPYHERDLRLVARVIPGFRYRIMAASAVPGELVLHVPCYRGVPVTGSSSVLEDEALDSVAWWAEHHFGAPLDPAAVEVRTVRVPALPLDRLGLAPTAVKIDVEGFEPEVLSGMADTLRAHRPFLLIEKCRRWPEIAGRLEGLGYDPFSVRDGRLRPFDEGATNMVFATPDHLAALDA